MTCSHIHFHYRGELFNILGGKGSVKTEKNPKNLFCASDDSSSDQCSNTFPIFTQSQL